MTSMQRDGTKGDSLRVPAAGAVKTVMEEFAAELAARAGRRLDVTFDTVGSLRDRVLHGEPADVAILSDQALEALLRNGIASHGAVNLGRTGIGLAGQAADSPALIDTPEQFRSHLVAAASIGYADPARGATAGTHFVGVIERLGLAEALGDRLQKFPFGVEAVAAVSRGEIACAVSQATEILMQPGVRLVGLFPEPFALWTAYAAVALSERPEAQALLDALRSPAVTTSLRRVGFA